MRIALLASAVLMLAGTAAYAASNNEPVHEMTVRLPGGGVEHIEYTGNVAPRVIMRPGPIAAWPADFWVPPDFAALDRISAAMDRQMDEMLSNARAIMLAPNGLSNAVVGKLGPGTESYSMTTISTGNGFCSRSTETTIAADGKAHTVTNQSGNCGGDRSSHATAAGSPDATSISYAPSERATYTPL